MAFQIVRNDITKMAAEAIVNAANTSLLNKIGTEISQNINASVSKGEEHIMTINLGTILGSRILSQILPNLDFKLLENTSADILFDSSS